MDVSGEQQIDVDHNVFKQRLRLDGSPFPAEPEKEELGKGAEGTNVSLKMSLFFHSCTKFANVDAQL